MIEELYLLTEPFNLQGHVEAVFNWKAATARGWARTRRGAQQYQIVAPELNLSSSARTLLRSRPTRAPESEGGRELRSSDSPTGRHN